jgi:hypothetical protein
VRKQKVQRTRANFGGLSVASLHVSYAGELRIV